MGWSWNDLTVLAGATDEVGSPDIDAYVFAAQGTQHVNYNNGSGHVIELWWDNSGWHHNDLTTVINAPTVNGGQTGYMFSAQGTQHVVYPGADNHVHELRWDNSGWHHNDLTMLTGGASGLSGGLGGSAYIPTLPLTYGYAFENPRHPARYLPRG